MTTDHTQYFPALSAILAEMATADLLREAGMGNLAAKAAYSAEKKADQLAADSPIKPVDVAMLYTKNREIIRDRLLGDATDPAAALHGKTAEMIDVVVRGRVAATDD